MGLISFEIGCLMLFPCFMAGLFLDARNINREIIDFDRWKASLEDDT